MFVGHDKFGKHLTVSAFVRVQSRVFLTLTKGFEQHGMETERKESQGIGLVKPGTIRVFENENS
jgi:hypothetical protein